MRPKPVGLVVLGVLSGVVGVWIASTLLWLDAGSSPRVIAVRAASTALAVAFLAAAEALIRVRPWFYRASKALVWVYCLVVAASLIAVMGQAGVVAAMLVLFFSLGVILPFLAYVRGKWMAMTYPAPPPTRPVPAPWPAAGRTP